MQVPLLHETLQALYFSTIQKLSGYDAATARQMLHEGIEIEVEQPPIAFWAVEFTRESMTLLPKRPERWKDPA